jgi:hypothetical protein
MTYLRIFDESSTYSKEAWDGMTEIPEDILNTARDVVDVIVAPRWSWDRPHAVKAVAEAILAERKRWKSLEFSGPALISIVEGVKGTMEHGDWRDKDGMRLKDTNEWVMFYTTFKSAIRGETP